MGMNDGKIEIITDEEKTRREKLSLQIKIEFQEDSLFRILDEKGWVERIFEGDMLEVRFNETYNTQRAAEILSLKDQQDIRNVFRNLKSYVRPDESSGHHRFDYKSIVRLRMIFLLKQEYSLTAMEKILTSLGKPGSPAKQTDIMYQRIEEMDQKLEIMAQFMKQLSETISGQHKLLEFKGDTDLTLKKQIEEQGELIEKLVAAQSDNELQSQLSSQSEMLRQLSVSLDPLQERQTKLTDDITKRRVEALLRKEALELWASKPDTERLKKAGFFRKEEDINKRDAFVEGYVAEHYASKIQIEYGL